MLLGYVYICNRDQRAILLSTCLYILCTRISCDVFVSVRLCTASVWLSTTEFFVELISTEPWGRGKGRDALEMNKIPAQTLGHTKHATHKTIDKVYVRRGVCCCSVLRVCVLNNVFVLFYVWHTSVFVFLHIVRSMLLVYTQHKKAHTHTHANAAGWAWSPNVCFCDRV